MPDKIIEKFTEVCEKIDDEDMWLAAHAIESLNHTKVLRNVFKYPYSPQIVDGYRISYFVVPGINPQAKRIESAGNFFMFRSSTDKLIEKK